MVRRRDDSRSNRRPAWDDVAEDVETYQVGHPDRFRRHVEEALRAYERDPAEIEPRLADSLKQIRRLRAAFADFRCHWRQLPKPAARLLAYNTMLGERGDGFDPTRKLTAETIARLDATIEELSVKLGCSDWPDYVAFADKGGQRPDIAALEFLWKMAEIYDQEIRDEPATAKPYKARTKTKKDFLSKWAERIGLPPGNSGRSRLVDAAIKLQARIPDPDEVALVDWIAEQIAAGAEPPAK